MAAGALRRRGAGEGGAAGEASVLLSGGDEESGRVCGVPAGKVELVVGVWH